MHAGLFGGQRALARVLQAHKAPSVAVADSSRLAHLFLDLAELGGVLEKEEDAVELVERFHSLEDIAAWLQSTELNRP